MKIAAIWTRHLKEQKPKSDFEATVRNSTEILTRLREIIDDWELEIVEGETRKAQYESPAWGYLQAHKNGEVETLRKIRELTRHLD